MTHVLSFGDRNREDDADEEILIRDRPVEQSNVDLHECRIPSDAAFLKHFTPKYISATGSRPRFMKACREFEADKDQELLPTYSVSGFGLLDACLHAYACNAILVLHPLDILLNLCYTYGNHRKKPINHNNEELKKITQIRLSRPFTRSHLILAAVARLARRIETYPLPKLFSLINTELSSPDPFVVRLAIAMICYLAGTRETTRLTLEHMRSLFELSEATEALMEPLIHNNWTIAPTGVLDVRHDPSALPSRRPRSRAKDANNQQATTRRNSQSRGATGDLVERRTPAEEFDVISSSAVVWRPMHMRQHQDQRERLDGLDFETAREAREAAVHPQSRRGEEQAAARSADLDTTNEMRVNGGEWRTIPDALSENRLDAQNEDDSGNQGSQDVLNTSGAYTNAAEVGVFYRNQRNNANRTSTREAEEWNPKKISPSSIYRIKKDNGIHTVVFKGSRRAWVELPEMMQELCYFFNVDRRVQNEILEIGENIQMSRLNMSPQYRKFWDNILFKNGQPKILPDADYQIDGWLSTLLGARLFNEQSGMNLRHLADMKTGVKLPVLLVRLPNREAEENEDAAPVALSEMVSDDGVLDGTESAREKARLIYYDDYREKLLLNSSGNAREAPVGLFMPWRSCEAVNRTRRLWSHVGGDSPTVLRPLNESLRSSIARNLNNVDSHTTASRRSEISSVNDAEVTVNTWTVKSNSSAKSRTCCGCGSKRMSDSHTEPHYNMCCLMSGICGFTLQPEKDKNPTQQASQSQSNVVRRSVVRPICFFEIAFEQ